MVRSGCGQGRLHHQQHRHFAPARICRGRWAGKITKGGLVDLQLNPANLPPKASTKVDSTSNLNSSEPVIDQAAKPPDLD